MIQSLTIRNIVLIEDLTIRFLPGMQVLSGETGAGKSIVVDSVGLILGGRGDRSLIRTGCGKASVEAVFDVSGRKEIRDLLDREQIDFDGSTVTIYREISSTGKNICRICGVITPLNLLRELGLLLMDIHGQHEHRFLMDPDMHLSFLDRMGDSTYQAQLKKTEEACEAFLEAHRQYARLKKENNRKQQRMETLEKSLQELHAAKLVNGEEESLQAEALKLRNEEKITAVLRSARESLSVGETEGSALEKIKAAAKAMESLSAYGDQMKHLGARCENAYYELEEAAFEISAILDGMERDPGRLERVEERLDLIRRMERKYGSTLAEVLAEQAGMETEYEALCALDDRLEEAGRAHRQLLSVYRAEAKRMTEARRALADVFERRMTAQLRALGMEKTVFSVCFQAPPEDRKPMPRPEGDDRIVFMISPNPGEALKPLDRIASGGELSRLMLAMKALEAEGSGVDCMVFDEIDTGISGRMAQVVAEKMSEIARSRQVICVTHLPQIAAAADEEFLVAKEVRDGRTFTAVSHLDREGRIREVARMVSGAEGSGADAAVYARRMLEAGEARRNAAAAQPPAFHSE